MNNTFEGFYESPIGTIIIKGNEAGISYLGFVDAKVNCPWEAADNHPLLECCIKQLDEYFSGKRKIFDLKLNTSGTDYQKRIWQELCKVPYGKTATYKEIAAAAGNEKAVRAVGGANNKNKISIIIPCHRIIGSNGSLTGYAGGLWRKEWLLQHEKDK